MICRLMNATFEPISFSVTPYQGFGTLIASYTRSSAALHSGL